MKLIWAIFCMIVGAVVIVILFWKWQRSEVVDFPIMVMAMVAVMRTMLDTWRDWLDWNERW